MKGEGNEPWREKAAEVSHRLNLRPFKRADEPETEEYEEEQITAEESAEDENSGEETNAENSTDDIDTEETEDTAEPEAEEEETDGEDEADAEQEENTDPFADEPFFEAEEDEEEPKPKKKKKRTVGEAKRADARRKRKLTEKEKRTRQRRKKIIKLAALITAAVMLAAAAVLTYFMLIVDSIEIYGCTHYDAEELIRASGLSVGKHMWLERIDEAENRMEQNAYIASAVVTRVYPDKLVVNITEREEAAVLVGMNAQAVIDKDGYVLYIGARADYSGLIQISGMGSSGYHVNQRLGEESDFNSRTMISLLEAVYSAGLEKEITRIDLGNPLSINMETASGVNIHLGQPDRAEEKLADFKTVLPTLRSMGYDTDGTLDLSAQGDPVYSPEKTAEPIVVSTPEVTADPNTTPDPNVTPDPNATAQPSVTSAPEDTPMRTPGPTDAFSG